MRGPALALHSERRSSGCALRMCDLRFLRLPRDLFGVAKVGAVLRLESKASGFSRTPPMHPLLYNVFLASRSQHMP